ncbi:hypothetical protein Misp03_66710 [Microbispora sp. NBRC 16548]|nr:hypothetical protein Misp03_66710 [Microbispora sp. NBRC 16548]
MLREAVGDPSLHGRQPLPLEQPQQAGRGVAVKAVKAAEVTRDVAAIAVIAAIAAIAVIAVAGRAVVCVVAGVHRPLASPRLPVPGRSVCILSFNTQSPGRVVHRQGAVGATGAEIA